jgi:hypothetical protein
MSHHFRQVGMMLGGSTGLTIEDLVVGGPAFNCEQLARGDEMLMVDDEIVNADNCFDRLIGSDEPGSLVKITFRSASSQQVKNVILTRVSATEMLNNIRVLENFTSLKDHAYAQRDRFALEQIDKGIDLWLCILRQESRRQYYFSHVQTKCKKILISFQEKFRAQKRCEEVAVASTESAHVSISRSQVSRNQVPGEAGEASGEDSAGGTGAMQSTRRKAGANQRERRTDEPNSYRAQNAAIGNAANQYKIGRYVDVNTVSGSGVYGTDGLMTGTQLNSEFRPYYTVSNNYMVWHDYAVIKLNYLFESLNKIGLVKILDASGLILAQLM